MSQPKIGEKDFLTSPEIPVVFTMRARMKTQKKNTNDQIT